jgi:hypothetical protein
VLASRLFGLDPQPIERVETYFERHTRFFIGLMLALVLPLLSLAVRTI